MNMQNKLCTIQFFHHLMTDSQPVPKQRSQNAKFCKFCKIPEKDRNPRKVQTPEQERIRTHGKENSGFLPCSQPHS